MRLLALICLCVIGAISCSVRRDTTPPRTYDELATRCGLTSSQLDSLLEESAAMARRRRGVTITPGAFGVVLGTTLGAHRQQDCSEQARFIAQTISQ